MARRSERINLKSRLEITGGKCAVLEKKRRGPETHHIVFRVLRHTIQNVTLYKKMQADSTFSFAICFELNKVKYFPFVQRTNNMSKEEEIQVQVRRINCDPSEITFDKKYLFRWGNVGTWKTLVSVAEPSRYLSVSDNRINLSCKPQHYFRIISE